MASQELETSRPRGSLFRQVLLTFVLTLAAAIITSGFMSYQLGRAYGPRWIEQTKTSLEALRPEFQQTADPLALEELVRKSGIRLDVRLRLESRPRAFLRGRERVHMSAMRQLRRGELAVLPPRRPLDHPKVLVPLFAEQSQRMSALLVAQPRSSRASLLLFGSLGGLIVLSVGAWILSRSVTRRVIVLEQTAHRLAAGDLSARTLSDAHDAGPPGDELDSLARSLDNMATRIDELLQSQRALLTNVSHELRTPIARMRVLAELMEDRPDHAYTATQRQTDAHRLQEDVGEMERLVQDLLTSGRLELGGDAGLRREPLDLGSLATKIASRFDADVDLPDDETNLEILADPMLMERVLSNLLGNARRACPEGEVRVEVRRTPSGICMAVEDRGPGIPEDRREEIFQAFVRLDAARARDAGGTGLGLYLSERIARAHGGTITARARLDGRPGARLEVRLPRAEITPSAPAL